jgi:hypothetical protein
VPCEEVLERCVQVTECALLHHGGPLAEPVELSTGFGEFPLLRDRVDTDTPRALRFVVELSLFQPDVVDVSRVTEVHEQRIGLSP